MDDNARILLIDDDKKLCESLQKGLVEEGFNVDFALTGEDGENCCDVNKYDVIILDILLPGKNGWEVCRTIRQKLEKVFILMLSARDSTADKVLGLNTGADDYLAKPFDFDELCARVRALLRRDNMASSVRLEVGNLIMEVSARQVWYKRRCIDLTKTEFEMLQHLMQHPGQAVNRTTLEHYSRTNVKELTSNLADVYIRRMRDKIGKDGDRVIQTVRGFGYRLKAD